MFGFFNINKPSGITSHDVIYKLRKILKIKKIGHAGTLDPLADGVLPVAVGGATRLIDYLSGEKEYIASFKLGFVSKTFDTEVELEKYSDKKVTVSEIENILHNFSGEIYQKPPMYSAVKIAGKKLYELARNGESVDVKDRKIIINKIQLINFHTSNQVGKILINCEKGTYIRSIINDLGQMLGAGGVMTSLTRTKSGGMSINNSVNIDELNDSTAEQFIIPVTNILNFENIFLNENEFFKAKNGNFFNKNTGNGFKFLSYRGQIIAMADAENNIIKILKVFI